MKRDRTWIVTTVLLVIHFILTACGGVGEADELNCILCGDRSDISGSISSLSGSQAKMAGWVVALIEKDTSIARVSEVDPAGLFTLRQVKTDSEHTIALLSPDYIVMSVLSIPGIIPNSIRQFFKVESTHLPKLIHKGPIVTMDLQNSQGIKISSDLASDQDADGVPDGMVSLGAVVGLNLQGSMVDLDLDGIPNEQDPDIDGDGVINVLDPDDNGNGILDVFDGDANGDLENDMAPGQTDTDAYFPEGVHFIAVQFELRPKDDGSGNETTLKFATKVRDEVAPLTVQVRGAPSLLEGATYNATDKDGQTQVVAWNRLLGDDGISEDSSAGDRLFAKKVKLKNAMTPRAHEAVFFQLSFEGDVGPWFMEFPYVFPDLQPAAITAQYDTNLKMVQLIGNPFGQYQEFVWFIDVYNEEGTVLWTSKPVPGTIRQFQIQDNALLADKSYKFAVVAQVLEKVPGFPSYTIYSPKYNLE